MQRVVVTGFFFLVEPDLRIDNYWDQGEHFSGKSNNVKDVCSQGNMYSLVKY